MHRLIVALAVIALSAGMAHAQQSAVRPHVGPSTGLASPSSGPPVLGFTCNPLFCACRGDSDCNDMFTTSLCGPRAICIDDVCYCVRK